MIYIRVFSEKESDDLMAHIYSIVNDLVDRQYKNHFKLVSDDSYTHAVVLDKAMPSLSIPKEHVIGIAREPIELMHFNKGFITYAQKHINRYFIGNTGDLPKPFECHYLFLWHLQNKRNHIDKKDKRMSIIFSHKQFLPGHRYRHQLVKRILASDLPIDIYGLGCATLHSKDPRIKGKFAEMEPYLGYQYSIAIENTPSVASISEKFTNCIAMSTIPVYYGATDIETYFGKNCCHRLNGNADQDMKMISDLCYTDEHYDLSMARKNLYYENAYFPEFLVREFCIKYEPASIGHWKGCFANDKICNINIPKNASTTIRTLFNLNGCDFYNWTRENEHLKTMIVIRNPMTRILSSFMEIMKLRKDGPRETTETSEFYKHRKNMDRCFELFLDYITNNFYDGHVLPQYLFLVEKNITLKDVDYVIDFDDLHNGLRKISNDIGISRSIKQLNPKKRVNIDVMKFEPKIRALYQKDFELYDEMRNMYKK